jgi:hypothetical protein
MAKIISQIETIHYLCMGTNLQKKEKKKPLCNTYETNFWNFVLYFCKNNNDPFETNIL